MRQLALIAEVLALFAAPAAAQYSRGWNFTWPTTTQQCQIPIQFPAGTHYSVTIEDPSGYAGGSIDVINPTPLQRVRESTNAQCLASIRAVPQEFTFDAFGTASQCGTDFSLAWLDRVGRPPYGMTVVPLDTSYSPWDTVLPSRSDQPGTGWRVNMTAGTRFTLVLSNENGWGRGGVGQVYEVGPGSNATCITQTYLGRVPWRAEINPATLRAAPSFTTTILAQTAPTPAVSANDASSATSVSTSTSDSETLSRSGDGSQPSLEPGSAAGSANGGGTESKVSAGVIGGAVAGGALALILLALLVWWLLKRKRDRTGAGGTSGNTDPNRMDLNATPSGPAAGGGSYEPKVVPYQAVPTSPSQAAGAPYTDYDGNTVQHGNTITAYQSSDSPYSAYDAARPMSWAGPLAGASVVGAAYRSDDRRRSSGVYGSASQYSPPLASGGSFVAAPALSNRMSQSSLSTAAAAAPRRSSHLDSPPGPTPLAKSVLPPTFTSSRTERPTSTFSAQPNRQSSLPPSAAASGSGSAGDTVGTHPHQDFEFVKHTDAGLPDRVDLPPEYGDVPRR